jgi:hypothetical protein
MINRIRLYLSQEEFVGLLALSAKELRSPSDQARWIIRSEMERLGLLKPSLELPCSDEDAQILSDDPDLFEKK